MNQEESTGLAARPSGLILIAAAVIWVIGITIEYPYNLQPPGSGALYVFDQALFLLAIAGFLTGILGLLKMGAAGDGKFGRFSLWLFASGQAAIFIASVPGLFDSDFLGFLFPVGGLASALGCLLSGIMVLRARRLSGWRRWSVLIYAAYYIGVLFLPLAIAGTEVNQFTETLWGLAWLQIGIALLTERDLK